MPLSIFSSRRKGKRFANRACLRKKPRLSIDWEEVIGRDCGFSARRETEEGNIGSEPAGERGRR